MKYDEIEHTADRALRICGRDLEELFANAAEGLAALMLPPGGGAPEGVARSVDLEAIDAESLLVAWLSELAFWAETESLIFRRFHFEELSATRLRAVVHGGPVEALEKHVKAVTFHELAIRPVPQGLAATVVFDV